MLRCKGLMDDSGARTQYQTAMSHAQHAPNTRKMLFLQGPHGPFFGALARHLGDMGVQTSRIAFNRGDAAFWPEKKTLTTYQGGPDGWSDFLSAYLQEHSTTDLVYYGGARPHHAVARAVAKAKDVTLHAFEEGYLRPFWSTYERGGANASSPLMQLSIDDMRVRLEHSNSILERAPDRWGDMRAHMFWGAAYHAFLISGQRAYPGFQPHRAPDPVGEFWLYLQHFLATPARRVQRWHATRTVRKSPYPYHVVLLQLAHDANFQEHSSFTSQAEFLSLVMEAFARGAPHHHRLVLKAHPLEDGREPLPPLIRALARKTGIEGRVHFLTGGKLARLLDGADSAVTVNSTSAEQALWRGLPLKAFGEAVYARPELVSNQSAQDFFANPKGPDAEAYAIYRRFLLATSQIPGGFYSRKGRLNLLKRLPDMMLSKADPYAMMLEAPAAGAQHLSVVR